MNQRLDLYLSELKGISRSAAQRLIEDGCVTVNGVAAAKNYRLREGDTIEAVIPEPRECEAEAQDIPLDIVYEDADLIVVNKPKGMVVHPAPGNRDGTLVNALLWHCGDNLSSGGQRTDSADDDGEEIAPLTGIGGVLRPGIVHRIDRDTSGLLVVAKNDAAHLFLSEQLKTRKMGRIYEAIVSGQPREDSFEMNAPIGRDPRDRKRMAVSASGREAITHCEVIGRYSIPTGSFSHVRLRLETGRTHQIRVHMAYRGYPCLGDSVYGGDKTKFARENASLLNGQCLHARTLEFIHPTSGALMRFDSGLPDYFERILDKLNKLNNGNDEYEQ